MRRLFQALLCLSLTLAFVLSGALRSDAALGGVTEMVICGEGGASTILLDAQGNPVDGKRCCDCVKCLPVLTFLPEPAVVVRPAPVGFVRLTTPQPGVTAVRRQHLRPMPRGPPLASHIRHRRRGGLPQPRRFATGLEFGQVLLRSAGAEPGHLKEVAR